MTTSPDIFFIRRATPPSFGNIAIGHEKHDGSGSFFNRTFAPKGTDWDSPDDPIREWTEEEIAAGTREGFGDEIEYDGPSDMFRFSLGSGVAPMCYLTNPRPGNPLAGVKLVAKFADLCWAGL